MRANRRQKGSEKGVGPEFLVVGRVIAPWGAKGELKVQVLTDFPQRFSPQQQVYVNGCPATIEESRRQGESVIIKLAQVDSIEAAENLRGRFLEIPRADAHPLPEGFYYCFQLIGLKVLTTEGESLGEIVDIMPTTSNDVYIVHGPRGEILIPAIDDVVKSVDLQGGHIVIEVIEGLL